MVVYLMVRFRVPLQGTAQYERVFSEEFLPLIREHGFEMVAALKTLVGVAGEYHELWRFEDAADFEAKWSSLFRDPRTARILEKTGPLVLDESTRLLSLAPFSPEL